MWFKQIQVFQLSRRIPSNLEELVSQLEPLSFKPCPPSIPFSMGWVAVLDEPEEALARKINHSTMICLQIEEKILPATVVRQALDEKVKELEAQQERDIRQKEKLALKDEITMTLLPRAFTKLTRVYAYIDVKHRWLVLGTANPKKTEQFLSMFKKTMGEDVQSFELKKLSTIMAYWLREKTYPSSFAVEKSAVLQDAEQQNRIIRCQQQDLFANSIQALIKDGCEIKQLALAWKDQINFVLADDFSCRSIQFHDEIKEQAKEMEPETKQQHFDTDFIIMTEILSKLLTELLDLFIQPQKSHTTNAKERREAVSI